MRTTAKDVNPGRRRNVPSWLANADQMAPCLCGMPLHPGQHYIVGTGDSGLERWFHAECWALGYTDDDDEDDDNWEEAYSD